MNVLNKINKETADEYTYTINYGGELHIHRTLESCPPLDCLQERAEVTIIFVDKKLLSVVRHHAELGIRSYWHVMKAIAEEIERIELGYFKETSTLKAKQ